ncbi:MAG: hypothetical protein AAFX94_16035 [Myxococcota bacterium]
MIGLFLITLLSGPDVLGKVLVDGEQLFTIEHTETELGDGRVDIHRRTLDADGKLAYEVEARLENGLQRTMKCDHRQRKLKGNVSFEKGRIRFERTNPDGSVTKDSTTVKGPAMSAPGLVAFMQRDDVWKQLTDGETVRFTYVSWSRQSTYGFRLKKSTVKGGRMTVVMQPSAWVIRQVFPDIYYTFSLENRRLLRYQGQVSVKKVEADGDLTDITADVYFRYL